MLRNRSSRAVSSKQAIMADHTPLPSSPNKNHTTPVSSFLNSPRFFNGFLARSLSDAEHAVSPTSILENKQFSNYVNPFGHYDRNQSKTSMISPVLNKPTYCKLDSQGIGLAIIDSIKDETKEQRISEPNSKMVLLGANLKVQVPSPPHSYAFSLGEPPKSPAEFGIKTRNSHILGHLSAFGSLICENQSKHPPSDQAVNGKLSLWEMELSEDYTCVTTHGPEPRTTHIFDNCIVDCRCGAVGVSEMKNEQAGSSDNSTPQSSAFLSFCATCKNKLQQGKDIYMYRGEKAFCSQECRSQEILSEAKKNSVLECGFRA